MFRIGEFSKIAQVSGRQLRHYAQLGLLVPEYIDPETGYRYYSASQLPRLNRILALKELGLSLEQIARLLNEPISSEELRGMLTMKKAQAEQLLQAELTRIRYIESRIQQIDQEGAMNDYDVVLKSVPAHKFLSLREVCPDLNEGRRLVQEMQRLIPARVGSKALGHIAAVMHSDMFDTENIDLEIGYLLNWDVETEVVLSDGRALTIRELPAVPQMLTVVRLGLGELGHGSYAALGTWAEANSYRFAGLGREVFIQFPRPGHEADAVTEIQFPVEKVVTNNPLLS
jgi:DNA-binding transcriptional MerR regulator